MRRKLLMKVIVIATTAIRKVCAALATSIFFSDDGSATGRGVAG
jgi:hypothetical protein